MRNGFYHERPMDYDIAVAPEMVAMVGAENVNWHVSRVYYEFIAGAGLVLRATVAWNEDLFVAETVRHGADAGWRIIAQKKE